METIIYKGIVFYRPVRIDNNGRCHGLISRHTRSGKMERGVCEICGDNKTHGHHEVYSAKNPVIRWLCHKHHLGLHAILDKEKRDRRNEFKRKLKALVKQNASNREINKLIRLEVRQTPSILLPFKTIQQ